MKRYKKRQHQKMTLLISITLIFSLFGQTVFAHTAASSNQSSVETASESQSTIDAQTENSAEDDKELPVDDKADSTDNSTDPSESSSPETNVSGQEEAPPEDTVSNETQVTPSPESAPVDSTESLPDSTDTAASDKTTDPADESNKIIPEVSMSKQNSSKSTATSDVPMLTSAASDALTVCMNILYAVETGGQVYGNKDYTSFTEAFAYSDNEKSITIGAGAWYAAEAKNLLNKIRTADSAAFSKLDTQGIGYDLDHANWSAYQISKSSAKAKCIQSILSSNIGKQCQDTYMKEQIQQYFNEASALGVTDAGAQIEYVNARHHAGQKVAADVVKNAATPYTVDTMYASIMSRSGPNQIGTYKTRQEKVYSWIKTYLPGSSTSHQTKWQKNSDGTWCYYSNGTKVTGWKKISSKWYYFKSDGIMAIKWQKINNKWYYLSSSNSDGSMKYGWQKINNKWYYFYSSGVMASGTTVDNYYIDNNGVYQATQTNGSVSNVPGGKKTIKNLLQNALKPVGK